MAATRHKPWTFENGVVAAERIVREYAAQLLRELPHVDDDTPRPTTLIAGYRWLTEAMVKAASRYQRASDHTAMAAADVMCQGTLACCDARRQEAKAIRAAWEVMHRQLVALKLAALLESDMSCDTLELVLLAEQAVEELAIDIDGGGRL